MASSADELTHDSAAVVSAHPADRKRHDAVVVDAPARLHLGFLDPSGSLGRRFASLGMTIEGFGTRVEVGAASSNEVRLAVAAGEGTAERLERYLQEMQRDTGRKESLQVTLHRTPPAHSGFGSGTQLALALGGAFCRFHRLEMDTRRIATVLGRGERSGVGLAGFDQGGLLLDGGPGAGGRAAPLLARVAFPDEWRVLLVLDERIDGLCGAAERVAIDRLPPFPRQLAAELCHQVLMRVLPGAIEHAFEPFAEGIGTIQRRIGEYFAPAQGGSMFTSPAVERMLEWIRPRYSAAIGQSSWGPTGFALMPSAAAAECAISEARSAGVVDPALRVLIVCGRNRGARLSGVAGCTPEERAAALNENSSPGGRDHGT